MIRSKDAGPFWLTLDVFFDDQASFDRVMNSRCLSPEKVAALYGVDPVHVQVHHLTGLRVVKISFPRPVVQGAFEDWDMHGGQHHVPLASVMVDR